MKNQQIGVEGGSGSGIPRMRRSLQNREGNISSRGNIGGMKQYSTEEFVYQRLVLGNLGVRDLTYRREKTKQRALLPPFASSLIARCSKLRRYCLFLHLFHSFPHAFLRLRSQEQLISTPTAPQQVPSDSSSSTIF